VTARRATALLSLALVLLAPAAARADGDPSSDVLLFQDAYLPFFPAPSDAEAQTLTRLLDQVRRDGYPMKVSVILGTGDLGAYPDLFGRPADYAKLLESELAVRLRKPHLLVVMPAGLAGRNLGAAGDEALAGVEIDAGAETDGLVRTAIEAVAAVAGANGHPTEVPEIETDPVPGTDGGRSYTALYIVSGLIALLGLALVGLSLVMRGRPARGG
jgi:hypothetical protein